MIKIIDPTNLSNESKLLLNRLLKSVKETYLKPGIHKIKPSFFRNDSLSVHLTHGLVIGTSKHNRAHRRVEVLEAEIGSGSYGMTYNSLGVIYTEKDMFFKVRKDRKSIIVKLIDLRESSPSSVYSEASKINNCSDTIHCKPALFNHAYGILRMTKAPGIPLSKLIDAIHEGNIQITLLDMLTLTDNLIKAVHHLHKKGWIHRDLKPNNIIVDPNTLEVTLIDFAFSRKKGMANHIKGNWYYIAPEYVNSFEVTRKIDWFSIGKSIAELWGDRSIHSFSSNECSIRYANEFHTCENFIALFHCLDLPDDIRFELKWAIQNLVRYNPEYRSGYRETHRIIKALIQKVEAPDFDPNISRGNCVKGSSSENNIDESSVYSAGIRRESKAKSTNDLSPDEYAPIGVSDIRTSVV